MRLRQLLHTSGDHVDVLLDHVIHFFVFLFVHIFFVHIDDPGDNDEHNFRHNDNYRGPDLL
jgi:hypothetical protein